MNAARRALGIAMAATAIAAPAVPAVADPLPHVVDVDATGYPDIVLTVDVDASVMPVTQFTVFEDGVEASSTAQRLTSDQQVILLVDVSGSMRGARLEAIQQAANVFISQLHGDVAVGLMAFSSEVESVVAMTHDRQALAEGIASLAADGRTALFDAIVTAAQQFSVGADQRTLVVFADGEDNHSTASLEQARAVLTHGAIRAVTVELLTEVSDGNILASLAAATGGQALAAAAIDELADRYSHAAQLIDGRYRVNYVAESTTSASVIVAAASSDAVRYAPSVVVTYPPSGASAERDVPGEHQVAVPARRDDVGAGDPPPAGMLATGGIAVALALVLLAVALAPAPVRLDADRRGAIGVNSRRGFAERAELSHAGGLWSDRLREALDRAGIAKSPARFALNVAGAGATAGLVTAILVSSVAAVIVAALSVWAAKLLLDIAADRRRKAFADQLDDTLQLLAASLRAGHSLLQAVDTVSREATEPTATEFRRIINATRVGQDLSLALEASVQRTGSEDFSWVAQAISIHREVGGNLAEVLDTVGETIRERNQIRRQVQALSAEGKLSAIVLMGLPIGILLFLGVVNPAYLARFTAEPIGWAMLAAVVLLMTCGAVWLRKLVRIDV